MSSQRHALRQFVRSTFAVTVTGVAAVLTAMPLQAAVFEELIVTAQKREQDIQDVGISVSAFTGDQLKVLGVQDSFDVALFVPNVNISGNLAGQNTQFSIRGVTQNDFNDVIEAPVAVYLDEGYIPPVYEKWGGQDLLDGKRIVRPRESLEWTRRLTEVGIFSGISAGAALAGAARTAERIPAGETATIVFIVSDSGWKYLSTGAWTDDLDEVVERAKDLIYF